MHKIGWDKTALADSGYPNGIRTSGLVFSSPRSRPPREGLEFQSTRGPPIANNADASQDPATHTT